MHHPCFVPQFEAERTVWRLVRSVSLSPPFFIHRSPFLSRSFLSHGCTDSRQFLLKHRGLDPAFSRPLGLSHRLIPLFVPRCYKPLQSMFSSHLPYPLSLSLALCVLYFSLSFPSRLSREITAAICLTV